MITVGGENLIDYVQTGLDGGLPVYTAIPGGSCYNVAIAIARQKQPVTYATPISNDSLGHILADRLTSDGVTLGAPRSDAPTSKAQPIEKKPTPLINRLSYQVAIQESIIFNLLGNSRFLVGYMGLAFGTRIDAK